jgi:PAS domain S-box-containing protein
VMLEEAAELAHMGTWEWDMDRRVITWSDEMYEIYGVDRATFVPTPESVLGRVSEDDRATLDSALDALRESGEMPHTEWRVERPDGTARWVVGTARRTAEAEAGPPRYVGTVRDVTDERDTRDELGAVHAVSETLAEWETFEEAVEELLSRIGTALGWVVGALWMPDERLGRLRCRWFWSAPGVDTREFETATRTLSLSRGPDSPPGEAWSSGAPVWVMDAGADPTVQRRSMATVAGLRGGVAFPIAADGQILGCLEFYGHDVRTVGNRLLRTLAALGEEMGRFLIRRGLHLRPSSVTPREREVLQLAARGRSTPQIAEDLVISQSTVKTHFEKIYDRLGVSDRPAAVAEGFRRGLLT